MGQQVKPLEEEFLTSSLGRPLIVTMTILSKLINLLVKSLDVILSPIIMLGRATEKIGKNLFPERKKIPERIVLSEDGFELYKGEQFKGRVLWSQVDKIEAYKADLITYDLVCVEFFIGAKNEIFAVDEEVEEFWE